MKPPAFAYRAPRTLDEALCDLDDAGDDAKVLAGGQSLIPMMNFRLARPSIVIDINRTAGLSELRRESGVLHVGAMTRMSVLERASVIADCWPVLRDAAGYVGHTAIRNRGTVGGSVAHADPTAELPVVLTALGARMIVRSRAGARTIDAADFFVGRYTTALQANELLVGIEVPPLAPGTRYGFSEYARTAGDFALAGACVVLACDGAGRCTSASIVLLGAGAVPWRAAGAERALIGAALDGSVAAEVAQLAVDGTHPPEPARHRRALLVEMTRLALLEAARERVAA
jgi:CO/xanthine dehydrogenase FAD-binding subunit